MKSTGAFNVFLLLAANVSANTQTNDGLCSADDATCGEGSDVIQDPSFFQVRSAKTSTRLQAEGSHSEESLLETGNSRSYWAPPLEASGQDFAKLMEWRRRNVELLKSEHLAKMGDEDFAKLLQAEHRAADEFGNGDGCVTKDEHPDLSLLVTDQEVGRICASHLDKHIRSPAFRRDVDAVRKAHQAVLETMESAQYMEHLAIQEELSEVNDEIPVEDVPNATDAEKQASYVNHQDLVGELTSQDTRLEGESEVKFGIEEGLMPWPVGEDDAGDNADGDTAMMEELETGDGVELHEDKALEGGKAGWGRRRRRWSWPRRRRRVPPTPSPCLYGRHDVCGLQLQQVPLLGTHNSGAYPTLYLECGRKKQECVDWATNARETCDNHVHECVTWGEKTERKCSSWGTECRGWAQKRCGWFGWLCGAFCTVTASVCTGFTWVARAVCNGYGWVCKGFTYFVEYVGCNVYKWACQTASDLGIIGCLWENHGYNFNGQLVRGARFFDIDSCLVNKEIRNCHGSAYDKRSIGDAVNPQIVKIRDWLNTNRREVVVIFWSNTENGLDGVDYPSHSRRRGGTYHVQKRTEAISNAFTAAIGTSCSPTSSKPVCSTNNGMAETLQTLVDNNIRLIVSGSYQDSYSDDSASLGSEGIVNHLDDHCNTKATVGGGGVMLSGFVSLTSWAAFEWSSGGTYNLECPNHCSHPKSSSPSCQCNAGTGQVQQMVQSSSLVEINGTSQKIACNSANAAVINPKVANKMTGIVDKCLARNIPVSVIIVDYLGKSNSALQTAHARSVDKAVAKFR